MSPSKKRRKMQPKKFSPRKISPDTKKKHARDAYLETCKKWIRKQKKMEYDLDEILEISSDEDSDDNECNLKDLEKPLKKLLRKRPDKNIRQRVNLECEWGKCSFETIDSKSYNNHVVDHMVPLENSQLKCLWNLCQFETEDRTELLRHLDYHAYHTGLKTFGLGLIDVITIPNCRIDSKGRNHIPLLPNDYFCYWNGCSKSYTKFSMFIEHVNSHLVLDYTQHWHSSFERRETFIHSSASHLIDIKVSCRWDGCEKEMPNVYQLKRHLKSHTNEKLIACSNCGTCFINKPLFIEHCLRQVQPLKRSFQCPDCFKSYTSEKLLKDHRRSHVNKFQCSLCGLSWQKQSVLARHILYRHMTDKPFSCDSCSYKGKTKRDLETHHYTHKTGDNHRFKCEIFQCNYSSKTLSALKNHDAREHDGEAPTYQCHCCGKFYMRGYLLSKHLKKDHAFQLAPGHSRFIYKQEFDGIYRLQTKRVENLKEAPRANLPVVESYPDMDISYEIDQITDPDDPAKPINVKVKRTARPRPIHYETPRFNLFTEYSADDSKDINDFEIFKKYKKADTDNKLEETDLD